MALTKKEDKEFEGLWTEAEGRMLAKMDFSVVDWLDEKEVTRFKELYKKANGYCYDSTCGDRNCENCSI